LRRADYNRDWEPTKRIGHVFDCVYGLLLAPDLEDALDSNLALLAYRDIESYRRVTRPLPAVRSKNRLVWRDELTR
jgi:ubiquitin-protein ligase